jgi:protein involved in polysaccharide export with SLBB domain
MKSLLMVDKLSRIGAGLLAVAVIVPLLAALASAQNQPLTDEVNNNAVSDSNSDDAGKVGGTSMSAEVGAAMNPEPGVGGAGIEGQGQLGQQAGDQSLSPDNGPAGKSVEQLGAQALMGVKPGQMTPGQLSPNGLAAALGITPDQLSKLKTRVSAGPLTQQELQQLCVQMATKHVTDAEGTIRSLGLRIDEAQLAQLKSCTKSASVEPPGAPLSAHAQNQQLTLIPQVSSIEQAFRGLDRDLPAEEPKTETLTQYGYSLFNTPVSTFAPVDNVPVGGDYLVGPGDQLKVLMWGRINRNFDLQVERDGTIAIPGIGPLQVAGLTFAQSKRLIEERAGQITGVQVDVTMGRLRSIQVFVIGEVNHPGPFTVSSLAHVSNVLVASGGITKIGSLRKVELRRGNKVFKVLDLYDVLMHGNTAADEQVQPNDVIFVPVIGTVTAVTGDVKRPAIYELQGAPADLPGVLKLAGGITAFGYSQRVQVERVENHKRRVVLDTNLDQLRSQHFAINDGDLVKIYPVLSQQNEIVTVKGNVYRPGKYEWQEGMRVADLIHEAEGLAPSTFMHYAVIKRQQGANRVVHLVPVDLSGALSDHLSGPANLPLQSKDELTVFRLDQIKDLPTVNVRGEVRNPGKYLMSAGMRVSDLVYMAGGLRDDAYLAQAQVARTQVINGASTRHTYMDIDLRAALSGSEAHNPELQTNDQLLVWRASGWHLPWVVGVNGQVMRPGPYTFHEGERLASVLERSGGMLPDAYLPGAVFIRRSVREVEQKSLDESRRRLRKQIAQIQLLPKQAGQSEENRNPQVLAFLEQVLEQSEAEQASGRVVVHVRPLLEMAQAEDNILLEDQDQITIPRRPSSINVLGQVYHPTALVYEPELTMRDYLDHAGGPTEGADEEHIFVFKADGSILTDDGIRNSGKSRLFPLLPVMSGSLTAVHLDPGDTVYVPEKLIYGSNLQYARDVAQIVASTIETVAVVAILGARL